MFLQLCTWLPFHRVLERLAYPYRARWQGLRSAGAGALQGLSALDNRFLENPALAMDQCRVACAHMAEADPRGIGYGDVAAA